MLKKIKRIFFNLKALIIALIILIIIGWGLTIYFGIELNSKKDFCSSYQTKIEKLNYYSTLLAKSTKLIQENKSLKELEDDVRLLDSGPLLAEWENAVFTGKQTDINNYLNVIIDSLTFFSK